MTDDLPAWAVRLRDERERRCWSQKDMAVELRNAADPAARQRLPALASIVRRVVAYEGGGLKQPPRGIYAELYSRALEIPKAELFGSDSGLERRDVLEFGVGLTAISLASHLPHQGPVAPELVMYFLEQLPGHYRADMWLGPRHLIPTVATQAQLIDELTKTADGPVRHGLLGAGVAYAALLGWLYQDAGDINQSGLWRAVALDMAHRSHDAQLISYALTNKAMLAVDLGDGSAVVDYAEAALADETALCPKVRVLGLVHQAHGHSFLGDRGEVDRLLDRAAGLVDRVDDEHPWGNACRRTRGYIGIQRATAYERLSAYREAAALWDGILGTVPAEARRDNGVFWARQAGALAAVPEPERVVEIAAATAAIVDDTGSARLRRELKAIPRHAAGWRRTGPGRELAEIIDGIT